MRRKLTPRAFAAATAPHAVRVEQQKRAAEELDAILGEATQNRPKMNWAKVVTECAEMRAANDWSKARAVHAVALYAWCHEQVYKVTAEELVGKGAGPLRERLAATSAADRLLKSEFGGDFARLVAFVGWAWREEKRKEGWAKGKGIVLTKRMGWRKQFSSSYAVDYRAASLRAKAAE